MVLVEGLVQVVWPSVKIIVHLP